MGWFRIVWPSSSTPQLEPADGGSRATRVTAELAAVEIDRSPVEGSLQSLGPLRWEQVRRTRQEPLFNSLIEQYHYLGYTQPVGEHLKYLVFF